MTKKKFIYDFITPSDAITFTANTDKVAYAATVVLSSGKAGCRNLTTSHDLSTILFLSNDPDKEMTDFLGEDINSFTDSHKKELGECLLSFAYGSPEDRTTYDDACEAITDIDKLKEFKKKHEYRNRTSMSKWVLSAWQFGNALISNNK